MNIIHILIDNLVFYHNFKYFIFPISFLVIFNLVKILVIILIIHNFLINFLTITTFNHL
jgi:hypothetical protein